MTTLFQVITLEGWPNIMEPIVTNLGPLYWLYFTSFIVIGTFIIINLFISVIVRKSEEAYEQVQRESRIPLTQQEIMQEIKEIRIILEDLEKRIAKIQGMPPQVQVIMHNLGFCNSTTDIRKEPPLPPPNLFCAQNQ